MEEIEISVFTSQYLNSNIDSIEELQIKATAWYVGRNRPKKDNDWQCTVDDARTKFKKFFSYGIFEKYGY